MRPVDAFHIGPQKSATTWVYRCLGEHPQVACARTDAVHYFDIHYAKGRAWYADRFPEPGAGQLLLDMTPSYIRSPWAPRRIARENPDARVMLCLRDPVERAFSHYWHERKKGKQSFAFREVLDNYDLFASWMEPGFYAEAIERYLEHFDRDQILALRFEELERDPRGFLDRILAFLGIDRDVEPSVLYERVNPAGARRTPSFRAWNRLKRLGRRLGADRLLEAVGLRDLPRRVESAPGAERVLDRRDEYEEGIPSDLERELRELCEPEIERLEELLSLELAGWRDPSVSGR